MTNKPGKAPDGHRRHRQRYAAVCRLRRWSVALVLVGVAVGAVQAKPQQEPARWQPLTNMPVGVFGAAVSQSGPLVVVSGGITQLGTASHWVQVLDLRTQNWRTIEIPTGVCHHAQATLLDGRILIIGGQTGQLPYGLHRVRTCWLVDPSSGTVTSIPPLLRAAVRPSAHVLPNGTVMVIAGQTASIFDPVAGDWTQHIPLCRPRVAHASETLPDGRVLVAGGSKCRGIEVIDPVAGHSQPLTIQLPSPIDDLQMVRLPGQRVWILGGQNSDNGNTTDQTWIVDLSPPDQPSIKPGPRLGIHGGVADCCVVTIGPWIMVVGGESQQNGIDTELTSARLLDRRTLEVWSLPELSHPSDDAVAIATYRGLILFGGYYAKKGWIQGLTIPVASNTSQQLMSTLR